MSLIPELDNWRNAWTKKDAECETQRAALAKARKALLVAVGLVEDAWYQFSIVVDGFDEHSLDAPRMDGCLSTLEDIAEFLVAQKRLKTYELRPDKDWFVRVGPEPAGEERTE